jgi:transcription elongation factor Elf1
MPFSPTLPMPYAHERYLGRPSCPKCGEVAVASEKSTYTEAGRIRHSWCCDACGHEFDTAVSLPR